jgi:hypothetical protein
MADDSTIPPIDARTLAAALDYREAMKESGDMAKIMLRTFKDINGMLDKNTENIDKSRSFQKEILSDAKARAMIQERVSSNISKLEEDILKLKVEQASVEYTLKDLDEEAVVLGGKKASLAGQLYDTMLLQQQIESEMLTNRSNQISLANELALIEDEIESLTRSSGIVTTAMIRKRREVQFAYNASVNIGNGLIAEAVKESKKENDVRISMLDTESKITENLAKQSRLRGGTISKDIEGKKNAIAIEQSAARSATYQAGFLAYMKDTAASSGGVLGNLGGMLNKGKDIANSFKKIPNPFILLKTLLETGLDLFVKLDKAAENFRKETGFSNTQMVELRTNAESVNREFQQFGIGIEESYKSAKALTDVFGRTSLVTKEALGNVALLAANLGVAESDSANVLANFQGLGKATQEAAMNVIKVGVGISEKAGIPFKLVMNDIANASEQTTAMLGANPSKLMKSAIAARALGTDMNKIVSSQRKLLDYSSSINDELETSALLGRSISFQKSRQLAYDGDIDGAAKATLDTVKKAGDFEKMSVYQREALAKAAGMELKDLTKMMAVEKQRDAILFGGDQAAKDKLNAQDAVLKKLKEEADLNKQSLLVENEKAIMQQKMQGLMTQMKNVMDSVMLSLGSALEPIIRVVVAVLVPAIRIVAGFIKGIVSPITKIAEKLIGSADAGDKFAQMMKKAEPFIEKMVTGAEYLGEVITTVGSLWFKVYTIGSMFGIAMIKTGLAVENVVNWFSKMAEIGKTFGSGLSGFGKILKPFASMFGSVFSVLMKSLGFIAKFAGPIGLIINIVQGVVEYAKELIDIWSSDEMSIGDKIIASLIAIPKVIWNVLVQTFVDAIDWVLDYFHVNFSLGDFFKEIGNELKIDMTNVAKFMLAPIFEAWYKVMDIIDGDGGIGQKILNGLSAVGEGIFKALTFPFIWAWDKISGWLGQSPSELGEGIVRGIASVGGMLLDAITSPFKSGFEFVTSAFSILVDGIKNIASGIFDIITSPFKKAFDFVKNLPLAGKLFGGSDDMSKQAKPPTESFQNVETSSVIEVKYLDELRDVVSELTSAVANLGTKTSETATVGGTMNTSALEAKLDTLTNLLVGGAVRVYLDGKDVSAAMSATGR